MNNLQSLEQRMDRIDYQVISDDKDKRIADLEAKLAEYKEQVEIVEKQHSELLMTIFNGHKENFELKQQLAEKEKELKLSKENEEMWFNWKELYYKEIQKLKQRLLEKDIELERYNRITSYVLENKLTQKEFNELFKKQTLIAIEQLERALDIVENGLDDALKNCSLNSSYYDKILDKLDQQINELKEGK